MLKVNQNGMIMLMVLACMTTNGKGDNAGGLIWNGDFSTEHRIRFSDHAFSWQQYRLALRTEAKLDRAAFMSTMWVRYIQFPHITGSADLFSRDDFAPYNLDVREAYAAMYGLFGKWLDIRVGRQTLGWGSADRMNPTEVLDPDDYEDIWEFGRHLGADCARAMVYAGPVSFEAVVVPVFKPAKLPLGDWGDVLREAAFPQQESPFAINSLRDTVLMPQPRLSNVMGGIRGKTRLAGYDFSLSYAYARDDFPVVSAVDIPLIDFSAATIDVHAQLYYPRIHMTGADVAGAIGDLGVRCEAALYFPEKVVPLITVSDPLLPVSMRQSIPSLLPVNGGMSDERYFKLVAGFDYTFANGIYVNFQYIRGFAHEHGDSLEDYFAAEARWDRDDGKLSAGLGGFALEIKDFSAPQEHYAVLLGPEITYRPISNLELTAGVRIIEGTATTTFGKAEDKDEIYVKTRYSF
jgi:hypothetical protein